MVPAAIWMANQRKVGSSFFMPICTVVSSAPTATKTPE